MRVQLTNIRCAGAIALVSLAPPAFAQTTPPVPLDAITVTATRYDTRAFDVPASVDIIDSEVIRQGQPGVNLSESLARVPGVFAANRQNYAQDLQISSRGFGARAPFGVRGVRLYQDGIPVTMPDGQGQTGSFSLLSAQRIEVVRGPFSTLYGNASGGVISVFTEDGIEPPVLTATAGGGSYDTYAAGLKIRGLTPNTGYVVAGSYFDTGGYRDHSAARRDLINAKLRIDFSDATRLTLIGNYQYQPETQDPLGLTRAQWEANPQQADPVATLFNTRKTIDQTQGGAGLQHRFNADTTWFIGAYGGRRLIRQYLAIPLAAQAPPTSSGGVTDLDRDYEGIGSHVVWRTQAVGAPLTLTAGFDVQGQNETRKGFINNLGDLGALKRDEDDKVQSADVYAEAVWQFLPAFAATLGVRSSVVKYKSYDHFVTPTNPDDSGSRTFRNTSPIVGLVYHATDDLNLYASYGQGFETPTFAELAYRTGGAGLNFDLNAATSNAVELGFKARFLNTQRINGAIFYTTTNQEIVIDTATGGRTTYQNVGKTRRKGAELLWDGDLGYGLHGHVALTYLNAVFAESFFSGTPPLEVPSGNKLPGAPSQQAYGELTWAPGGYGGLNAGIEAQYVGKIYVNDRNTDSAPPYTVTNVRVGLAQTVGRAKISEFVRVNNVFDKKYIGSVIVGDTNGRYFEPAPPRNWFVGINIDVTL